MNRLPKYFPLFCFAAASVLLLIFSWSTSPLYLTYGGDSPFFQIIGLGFIQGKVPYVDLFDHKGPLPFFIDGLGYATGWGRTGIFVLQLIFMTATLWLMGRLAALFSDSAKRNVTAVALTLIPMVVFITEGNQVEEWELPFVTLALYIVFKYLFEGAGRFPVWKGLLMGELFAIVFYVRPNDGVMWVGSLFFGLFLLWIVRRQWRTMFANVAAFLGGCAIVSAPIFGYFSYHHAVGDFIYGMIWHNMRYAGDALFTWGGIGMILIPALFVGIILYLLKKEGRREAAFLLVPMLVFTVALIGKRDYYHYLIPFTPYMTIAFALCLKHGWKAFLWVVCLLFAVFSYRECTFVIQSASKRKVLKEFYAQSDSLFAKVPENERNTVWNYNLVTYQGDDYPHMISLMGCFPHAGLTPSSPVLAAYDLLYLNDTHGIRAREPKWVIMCPSDSYDLDFDYIEENYSLVASSPAEPVCELRLYRRK